MSESTQLHKVGALLLQGETLNTVKAGTELCIWRLSSIIHRLRARSWPVETERKNGNGIANYRLPPGWKPHAALPLERDRHEQT